MNTMALIHTIPLFDTISAASKQALAGICAANTLKKKELLFLEGDEGVSLFILLRGSIQLYKVTPEGKEVVIKIVKPGEMFAEVVLFKESTYPVNAIALQDSTLLAISRRGFVTLLSNDAFRDDFIANLLQRMRFLVDQIQYLTNHDVEERLNLFLRDQFGDSSTITITLSKKEVAGAIATTPETLSRLLHRLKQESKLLWEGTQITRPCEPQD